MMEESSMETQELCLNLAIPNQRHQKQPQEQPRATTNTWHRLAAADVGYTAGSRDPGPDQDQMMLTV